MTTSLTHIAWRPSRRRPCARVRGPLQATTIERLGQSPHDAAAQRAATGQRSAPGSRPPPATSTAAARRVRLAPQAVPPAAPGSWLLRRSPDLESRQTRQFHFGVDVSAPNGTPVYATLTGPVWIHPRTAHRRDHRRGRLRVQLLARGPGRALRRAGRRVRHADRPHRGSVRARPLLGGAQRPLPEPAAARRDGPLRRPHDPWVARLTAENGDRQLQSLGRPQRLRPRRRGRRRDAARDPAPLARPTRDARAHPLAPRHRPWPSVSAWRTVADFRETIPPASEFDRVWAPGTTQNHVRSPGRYRLSSPTRSSTRFAQAGTRSRSPSPTPAGTQRGPRSRS